MNTREHLDALGGVRKIYRELHMPYERVRAWYLRNRVSSEYFPAIVDLARRRGVSSITFESLTLANANAIQAAANDVDPDAARAVAS